MGKYDRQPSYAIQQLANLTFALKSLRKLGKASLLKYKLINLDSGIDNCFLKSFKILVRILLQLEP